MSRTLSLENLDLVELLHARGATLRVLRGCLWVTQEGERRDIVLDAGRTWTIERSGRTLAQAQRDTTVMIVGEAKVAARLAGSRRGRLTQLARGLAARYLKAFRRWRPTVVPYY